MNSANTIRYRADIDGLRALAVAPVVLYHVGFGVPGGFAGVDVFFVISGYLITAILLKELSRGDFSVIRFYERRARRLFPALFAMLLVSTAVASNWLLPDDLVSYAKSAIATLFFVSNIFFYTEIGYFNELAQLKPLLHTWSLGVEEQFYLIVPLTLAVLWRFFPLWAVRLSIVIVMLFSFSIGAWLAGHHAGFYLPVARAWELGIGMILAVWATRVASKAMADALGFLGLGLLFVTFAFASSSTPWPGFSALLPCVGAGAIILSGNNSQSTVARLLSIPIMVGLGKISYSLYLWHWPVIAFASYGRFDPLSGLEKVVLLLGSVALALLSWQFIEQPIRRKRFLATRGSVVVSGALATTCVAALATILVWTEGLPNRVPTDLISKWQVQDPKDSTRACHGVTPARAAAGNVCKRGAEGSSPSFILVGDSHAHALSSGVFEAADRLGISGLQFTGPGFVPTPDRYRVGSVARGVINDERIDSMIRFVQDRPEIELVLITGWWHRYATGESYRDQDAIWSDGQCASETIPKCNATSLQRSLLRLADKLKDRDIVFLDDVPVGWELHPKSHYRFAFRGNADHRPPVLSLGIARAQYESYSAILESVADEKPNVKFRPIILTRLCGEQCSAVDSDGKLIFNDGDHLSRHGAQLLVGDLGDILNDFRGTALESPNSKVPKVQLRSYYTSTEE